jgi:predicted O-methyltransferase YrrM
VQELLRAHSAAGLKLSRKGTLIVADNVVRPGAVVDATRTDPNAQGVSGSSEMLADEPRINATAVQTTGGNGYDRFALAFASAENFDAE